MAGRTKTRQVQKTLTAAAKKRILQEKEEDCCYTVVVRPVPMTQSDCYPGDYNMTTWPLNCLCRDCS